MSLNICFGISFKRCDSMIILWNIIRFCWFFCYNYDVPWLSGLGNKLLLSVLSYYAIQKWEGVSDHWEIGPEQKLFCLKCRSLWGPVLHVLRYANEDMLWLGHPRQWLRLTKVHKAASASLIKALSNYRIVIDRLLCVFLPSLLVSKVCSRSI